MTTQPKPAACDPWITRWLSEPRFGVYLTAAGQDPGRALDLYEWNAAVGAAMLRDLAHLEVGLRNAYDRALADHGPFHPHWTRCAHRVFAPVSRSRRVYDPATGTRVRVTVDINEKPRKSLERAVREAGGRSAAQGKVVAQLMFGFWRYLSSSAHEVPLWRPYLHHAFPRGTSRAFVDERVGDLHDLRNRVAHHEPVFRWNLVRAHQQLLEISALIAPELERHISRTSQVGTLLLRRP